jgi:CRP/FNR family transcriptional regulator, cyclic AMP receptor protein
MTVGAIAESPTQVRVLEFDRALAARLEPELAQRASAELIAPATTLAPGPWSPPRSAPEPAHLGYLVLGGLIIRRVEVGDACSVELLSDGDLLRPWQEDSASFVDARWEVLRTTQMAELTAEFATRLCRYPHLAEALMDRTMSRARSLATFSAIDNIVGVQRRIYLLLWHLAERWGRVDRRGVIMPLPLTHQVLADLIGSRRPSVSTALRRLAEAGMIAEDGHGGWRLTGAPPSP